VEIEKETTEPGGGMKARARRGRKVKVATMEGN